MGKNCKIGEILIVKFLWINYGLVSDVMIFLCDNGGKYVVLNKECISMLNMF